MSSRVRRRDAFVAGTSRLPPDRKKSMHACRPPGDNDSSLRSRKTATALRGPIRSEHRIVVQLRRHGRRPAVFDAQAGQGITSAAASHQCRSELARRTEAAGWPRSKVGAAGRSLRAQRNERAHARRPERRHQTGDRRHGTEGDTHARQGGSFAAHNGSEIGGANLGRRRAGAAPKGGAGPARRPQLTRCVP